MFEVPEHCPAEIKTQLRAAFTLFWCDEAAAANRVRIALERLMDHMGVRSRRRKPGRIVSLTLHDRIEIFRSREPTIGKQLMALKLLGNTGSHRGQVQRDDLLDAFEILEHALAELIDRRTAKVEQLARELSRRHTRTRKSQRRGR
jgi:hypothetical protein